MKLSPTQSKLYECFKRSARDYDITHLYSHVYGAPGDGVTVRKMQQRLGPIISRANRRLDGKRIVPGALKRSYRLVDV